MTLVVTLAIFILGLLAILVFWHLAKNKAQSSPSTAPRGWGVLVGSATILSAAVALAQYLH